jgi:hypothetical protein
MASNLSHDYEMQSYDIAGDVIRFALTEPARNGGAHSSVELVFRDVEGYFFRRNATAGVALAVEELELESFLADNEAQFSREARWGWPRFWQGSAERTTDWLVARARRVWTVTASYRLSGWIVAGAAAYHNAVPNASPGVEVTLADVRPVPRWPRSETKA